uniref:Nesprin-1 n=1 Tax=Schistocephalus solidus TaxID=70667 RepID=A0A183SMI0_SCHSO
LANCLVEMSKRRQQGILLGIQPSDLERIEAEWTRVKPALDEWRWRLDDSLPGDWVKVGRWLSRLERCLNASASLAIELNASNTGEPDAATRRVQFAAQLGELEEAMKSQSEICTLLEHLVATNESASTMKSDNAAAEAADAARPNFLIPPTVANAIQKRFHTVYQDARLMHRRIRRLYMRWKLGDEIESINEFIGYLNGLRCEKLEEANENLAVLEDFVAKKGLPQTMEDDIAELTELAAQPDDVAIDIASETKGSQSTEHVSLPGSGMLAIQIRAGGGTTVMRDIAETERNEANMFLSSLRVKWANAQTDLSVIETMSKELSKKWEAYETEAAVLFSWLEDAEAKLRSSDVSTAEKRGLLSQVKKWRERLTALSDLGQALIGHSSMKAGEALSSRLAEMAQRLEVIKLCEADDIARLQREHEEALRKLQSMLSSADALLDVEFHCPQTTSIEEAEASTLQYRRELQATREMLRKQAENEYLIAKALAEKLLAAAKAGEMDMEEAMRYMEETERARKRMLYLADEGIDKRLSDIATATQEAVQLAVQLAQMSEWIEEAETVTYDTSDLPKESTAEVLAKCHFLELDAFNETDETDDIFIQMHCVSISAHQKALAEAEKRLEELKSMGLKNVNTSQLEAAIAETRERIEIMLEAAKKREELLVSQNAAKDNTNAVLENLEKWMQDANDLLNTSHQAITGDLSSLNLSSLEKQLERQEAFIENRSEGDKLLDLVTKAFDDLLSLWPKVTPEAMLSSEAFAGIRDTVERALFRDTQETILALRFVVLDKRLEKKLKEASEKLRIESIRIENGDTVSEILNEHEEYFSSSELLERVPAMLSDMQEITEKLVELESAYVEEFAQRTEVQRESFFVVTARAEQLAKNMRVLPDRWLDFDTKLSGLVKWTNELESLAGRLREEGSVSENELLEAHVAADIAARYRAMLMRFEELADSTDQNVSMAERLNNILTELLAEGGLPAAAMAQRRTSLARVLNSLHDLQADVHGVLQSAPIIAQSLEYRASVATEQDRANKLWTSLQEGLETDFQSLSLNSEELRRLMAEREALIARVNREKEASLANLMRPTELQDLSQPAMEEQLRQSWADVDRLLEQQMSNLRTAAHASEQFTETRGRIQDLINGAKHLLSANANSQSAAALSAALAENSDLRSFPGLSIDRELEDFAKKSLAAGLAGIISASIGASRAAGPSAVRAQTAAVQAQLELMLRTEADFQKLRRAAQLISNHLGPEKSAELEGIIAHLEQEMQTTRMALEERLVALKEASSRWAEIYEDTRRLETQVQAQETDLASLAEFDRKDLRVDLLPGETSIETLCAQITAEIQNWQKRADALSATTSGSTGEIQRLEERFQEMLSTRDEGGDDAAVDDKTQGVEAVSTEVAEIRKTIAGLSPRVRGVHEAADSLSATLQVLVGRIKEFSELGLTVENNISSSEANALKLIGSEPIDSLDVLETALDDCSALLTERNSAASHKFRRMQTLSQYFSNLPQILAANSELLRRWELSGEWLEAQSSLLTMLSSDWRTWSADMAKLSALVSQLKSELEAVTQEAERIAEDDDATAESGGGGSRGITWVLDQEEQLQIAEARWKGLRPQATRVAGALLKVSGLAMAAADAQSKTGSGGASSLQASITVPEDALEALPSNHPVQRQYNAMGSQITNLHATLQRLHAKLEGELSAQDKFASEVEQLALNVRSLEKRLAKLTNVWVAPASLQISATRNREPTVDSLKRYQEGGTPEARPDENIVQKLPVPRLGVHPLDILPHRKAEEGVGQQEAMFRAGLLKKESVIFSCRDHGNPALPLSILDFIMIQDHGDGGGESAVDAAQVYSHYNLINMLVTDPAPPVHTVELIACDARPVNGYLELSEALAELRTIVTELTGPMQSTLQELCASLENGCDQPPADRTVFASKSGFRDHLRLLSREMQQLGLRALKRQHVCEVTANYRKDRAQWQKILCRLRSRQEHLIVAGSTVCILPSRPPAPVEVDDPALEGTDAEKLLSKLPVESSYQDECEEWERALLSLKSSIHQCILSAPVPQLPDFLREAEAPTDVTFANEFLPQELDTAAVAAGIFFVTSRMAGAGTVSAEENRSQLIEPFSLYVDVGRIATECDKLRNNFLAYWTTLDAFCTQWQRFSTGCEDFVRHTDEFLTRVDSVMRSAVELTDVRLERPGNHKRLVDISTQFKNWQQTFSITVQDSSTSVTPPAKTPPIVADEATAVTVDANKASDLPLVSRYQEFQLVAKKIMSQAPSRLLSVKALLEGNTGSLLKASMRLGELSYQVEILVQALDRRENALKEMNDLLKEVEQVAGIRRTADLAASLLAIGQDGSSDVDSGLEEALMQLGEVSLTQEETSFTKYLEEQMSQSATSLDLSHLLTQLAKARTLLRGQAASRNVKLQQASSAALQAYDGIMSSSYTDRASVLSPEMLESDFLRNWVCARWQDLSQFLDQALVRVEAKHQTMVSIEVNFYRLTTWLNEFVPCVQKALQVLLVSASEGIVKPESTSTQLALHGDEDEAEDPADILERFQIEHDHYSTLFELTQREVESDGFVSPVFAAQIGTIQSRYDSLIKTVQRLDEVWTAHQNQSATLLQQIQAASECLDQLMHRLDGLTLESGIVLPSTASMKERVEAARSLFASMTELQKLRAKYLRLVATVGDLSQRCFHADGLKMRLKRKKLFRVIARDHSTVSTDLDSEVAEETEGGHKSEPQMPNLSKHCATLSFRLASMDTSSKQCLEVICRKIEKLHTDAMTAWETWITSLSEKVERCTGFADLPLLLKNERREMAEVFFTQRSKAIQELLNQTDLGETSLLGLMQLSRIKRRAALMDEPDLDYPSQDVTNFAEVEDSALPVASEEHEMEEEDVKSLAKIRTSQFLVTKLRQQIIEYLKHIHEAEKVVLETFSAFGNADRQLSPLCDRLDDLLTSTEPPSLAYCERSISLVETMRNDLQPIRSEVRELRQLCEHSERAVQVADAAGAFLINTLQSKSASEQGLLESTRDQASRYFAQELVEYERTFQWLLSITGEAAAQYKYLADALKNRENRQTSADEWISNAEAELQRLIGSPSDTVEDMAQGSPYPLDQVEAEKTMTALQVMVTELNTGRSLIDLLESATTDLFTATSENSRWTRRVYQARISQCRALGRQSESRRLPDSSEFLAYRSILLDSVDALRRRLEDHTLRVNTAFSQAALVLAKCSSFAENCDRFEQWLSSVETGWVIPPTRADGDVLAAGVLTQFPDRGLSWELQALVTTYQPSAINVPDQRPGNQRPGSTSRINVPDQCPGDQRPGSTSRINVPDQRPGSTSRRSTSRINAPDQRPGDQRPGSTSRINVPAINVPAINVPDPT